MGQYRVRFIKRLCNDVGLRRSCLQALVDVRSAKTAERALQAAQKPFEPLQSVVRFDRPLQAGARLVSQLPTPARDAVGDVAPYCCWHSDAR